MKLQPEHKFVIGVGVAVAVALFGIVIIMGVYRLGLMGDYERSVGHSYPVRHAIAEVLLLSMDAESAQRGFLLTGEQRFLEPFEIARSKLPDALHRLHDLVAQNPEQATTCALLLTTVHRRLELLTKVINERRNNAGVPKDLAMLDFGSLELDKIRLLASGMVTQEEVSLGHRKQEAQGAVRQLQRIGSLLLVVSLGSLPVLYIQLQRLSRARRQSEALRQSEARFRAIADKAPSMLWQLDAKGRPMFINQRWFEYTGTGPQQYASTGGRACIHTEDWPNAQQTLMAAVEQRQPWSCTFRVRARSGQYGWFLGQGIALFKTDGELDCYLGQSVEITELNAIQEALMAEKQRLAATLHSIGDGVVTTDTQGRVTLLNRQGEHLTGWSQAEAIGRPLEEVFYIVEEFTRLPMESPFKGVLHTGRALEPSSHTVLISREGKERIIAASGAPIRDAQNRTIGAVFVLRDSTPKQELAEELMRSNKLQSLGVLAGGIAHDFNNLLGTVLGNISLVEHFAEDRASSQHCLQESRQACLRAKDLTQQLLAFAKGGVVAKKLAGLQELIAESTHFALHGSSAQVIFNVARDLYPVMMDVSQISQVLHNIVLNAVQAMPDGGLVRVTALNIANDPSGKMVKISISDTGVGILPEHQVKIFDPYFTTKQNGTGLGLASAYSIIKKHEGHITVESTPGVGTTFHILLPAHDEKIAAPASEMVADGLVKGHGRLLVLEDDAMLARMLKLMLCNLGYEVTLTATGSQAIDLYRAAATSVQPFDGCLFDLTIAGGINGAQTLQQIHQINPSAKALVCSGYSNDRIVADFKEHGFFAMVTKPYSIEEISRAVHAMLQSGAG